MSTLWMRDGKLLMKDGKLLLADECCCDTGAKVWCNCGVFEWVAEGAEPPEGFHGPFDTMEEAEASPICADTDGLYEIVDGHVWKLSAQHNAIYQPSAAAWEKALKLIGACAAYGGCGEQNPFISSGPFSPDPALPYEVHITTGCLKGCERWAPIHCNFAIFKSDVASEVLNTNIFVGEYNLFGAGGFGWYGLATEEEIAAGNELIQQMGYASLPIRVVRIKCV